LSTTVFFSLRNLKVAATCSAPRSQQHKTSFNEYLPLCLFSSDEKKVGV